MIEITIGVTSTCLSVTIVLKIESSLVSKNRIINLLLSIDVFGLAHA